MWQPEPCKGVANTTWDNTDPVYIIDAAYWYQEPCEWRVIGALFWVQVWT